MSKLAEQLEEIIDEIIDLESFENRRNIATKLQSSQNKIQKMRSELDEQEIMKMGTKKELEELGSELTWVRKNERIARLKTEEI